MSLPKAMSQKNNESYGSDRNHDCDNSGDSEISLKFLMFLMLVKVVYAKY